MSGKQSGTHGRTWISAEISPELMEALKRRASARGISRSEGLRQALRQWSIEEDQDTHNTCTAEERGQRIVAHLDDLREEILLQIAGEGPEASATEKPTGEEASLESGTEDYSTGVIQLELYEGE